MHKVKIFGSESSPDSRLARQLLARWLVPFEWVDIDASPEARQRLQDLTGGRVPAIVNDDRVLAAPSLRELERLFNLTPRLDEERPDRT